MKKFLTLVATCGLLAGCIDPLSKVDKLSSVELAEDMPSVAALPDPADVAGRGGLLSGLFKRDPKPEPALVSKTDAAVGAALGLSETELDATALATIPEAAPESKSRGLLGFLRAKENTQPAVSVAALAAPASDDDGVGDVAETVDAAFAVAPEKQAKVIAAEPDAVEKPRRGLLGLLAGARVKDKELSSEPVVRTASLGGALTATPRKALATPKRKNALKHKGPDAQIVAFGTSLPSGAVARVCDLPSGRLGKHVEQFPARGRGYKLIDSNPGSSMPRPFYVTGFDDKCARTFTAALALFGSPTMHEQLRYGLPSKVQPYSTTDKAYEGIKRSVCGVGKQKPCGAKIKSLEKNTVFISTYDRIGSNAQWSNILVHDGWVVAADRKG